MEVADRQTILAPGDKLGCYRIDSFLGQGGFGVTYLARDTMLDLQVAIKEYLPEKIAERIADAKVQPRGDENGEVFRRGLVNFLKEARTLARFKHPNIVRVMSVFELNGTAYMVMEYERGHDLKLLFNRREHVSESQLRAIVGPVIDGLAEVHRHGFIHRDIKPANILVRDNGSPVLLDFGSARLAVGHDTGTMTAMVTVGFAPLEQYSGLDEQQGPWTDIYALGAVLYYAVTGEAPLDSTLRGASVLNDKPDPLVPLSRQAPDGYGQSFCQAVDWALKFKVSDRPQELQQWREQLFGDGSGSAVVQELDSATTKPLPLPNSKLRPGSAAAVTRELYGDDAPTVIRKRPPKRIARDRRENEEFELQSARTVLIEDQWDISDVGTRKRGKRRSGWKKFSAAVPMLFPLVLMLSAGGLLAVFKPWKILQNSAPQSSASSALSDASVDTELAEPLPSGDETNSQLTQSDTFSSAQTLSPALSTEAGANTTEISTDASASVASVPVEAIATTPVKTLSAEEKSTENQDNPVDSVTTSQATARYELQLEVDRAVQRAEAARMARLQAELEATEKRRAQDSSTKQATEEAPQRRQIAGSQTAELERNAIKPLITNADMVDVLTRFNALSGAIESGDGVAMRRITVNSERKYAYFDFVFRTFDKVEARVGNISASRQDQKIRATLTISRLIRDNGDIVIPPEEFNNIPIYSVKEKQWSAIHW